MLTANSLVQATILSLDARHCLLKAPSPLELQPSLTMQAQGPFKIRTLVLLCRALLWWLPASQHHLTLGPLTQPLIFPPLRQKCRPQLPTFIPGDFSLCVPSPLTCLGSSNPSFRPHETPCLSRRRLGPY